MSNVTASIQQYGAYVQFTDQLVETAIDPYLAEAAYVLGEHAGSSIDLITRNILTAGTNLRLAGAVGSRGAVTASSIVNSSEIRRVLRSLKRSNARPFPELNGKFAGIVHTDVMVDLLSDSTITQMYQRAAPPGFDEQPELLGYVGEYLNVAFFETTNARIYSSAGMSGADVYASLFLGKDAYGITEIDSMGLKTYYQPLGSSGAVNDPLGQIGSIGWKAYHAAAILNQSWLQENWPLAA